MATGKRAAAATVKGDVRCGVYARFSSDDKKNGVSNSVQEQEKDCRAKAKELNWKMMMIEHK